MIYHQIFPKFQHNASSTTYMQHWGQKVLYIPRTFNYIYMKHVHDVKDINRRIFTTSLSVIQPGVKNGTHVI